MITQKRIYIAGPMTGYPNYNREAFFEAAIIIKDNYDFIPIHSAWMLEGYSRNVYKDICFDLIRISNALVLIEGWEDSVGAKAELEYAQELGLPIYLLKDRLLVKYGD